MNKTDIIKKLLDVISIVNDLDDNKDIRVYLIIRNKDHSLDIEVGGY